MSRRFLRVFVGYVLLTAVLVCAPLVVVLFWQDEYVEAHARAQLYDTALLLRERLLGQDPADVDGALQRSLQQFSHHSDTRLTILGKDGVVLADSHDQPSQMDNHLDRPEIQEALRTNGMGSSLRRSPTLGVPLLYVAVNVVRDGQLIGFARAARNVASIQEDVSAIRRRMMLVVVLSTVVTAITSLVFVDRALRPMWAVLHRLAAAPQGDSTKQEFPPGYDLQRLEEDVSKKQVALNNRLSQLHETNQRLVAVMENMAEGVIVVDPAAVVLFANKASRRLLDFPIAEPIGHPLWELTRNRPLLNLVERAIQTGESCREEIEQGLVSNRLLTVRASRFGQDHAAALVVLHDISELRRLESLRRDFVANVSHELKTPLASIKAFSETLRLGAIHDSENNLVFLGRIEEQADRLHELILDLLQLARVESGREAFEITTVSVLEIASSCGATFQTSAQSKGIELIVAADQPDPSVAGQTNVFVLADAEGLRTILNNLIDNAIKYTPSGGRVVVRWRQVDSSVAIEVQDTGIGIPISHQSRIFERFYRVDKARSRELGGTGLGLSIVKHLVQSFGGFVSVESSPRQGSTFRVTLPRSEST